MSDPHARFENRARRETQTEERRGTSEEAVLPRVETHRKGNHQIEGESSSGGWK